MRIIHLSYARVQEYTDPKAWLSKLSFFSVLLKEMARYAEVKSIHLINCSQVLRQSEVEYHFLKKSKWEIFIPVRIHHYLKGLDPDIVVVHGLVFPLQVLFLRSQLRKKVKLVMIHHAERPLRYHRRVLQKFADRFIDAYFFNSVEVAEAWVKLRLITRLSKVHEVMIGSSVFSPLDRKFARTKILVEASAVYLWVGHLDENKDPETLVRAFKQFVELHPDKSLYLIYQENFLLEKIRALAAGCHQINLIGRVEHQELLYWYSSADFIVSTSHYEGGGTAVCEGMSCGCIPILTDIPSFRMMTENEKAGLLFPPGNVPALTNVLLKSTALNLPEERNKVLKHFQAKLSNQVIANKMMAVFKSFQQQ
jgi:glycosyltransferase involved in cell wall biosynthesis